MAYTTQHPNASSRPVSGGYGAAPKSPATDTAAAIACAADHAYFCGLLVTLHSLCTHAAPGAPLRLHVFDTGLTQGDREVLKAFPTRFPGRDIRVLPHAADVSAYKDFPAWRGNHTAYVRLALQDLLPEEDFVVYTDVDTLWLRDVTALWALRSDRHLLWAVPDGSGLRHYGSGDIRAADFADLGETVSPDDYFCSGLLLMNLRRLRTERFTACCAKTLRRFGRALAFPDQDLYNLLCPPPKTCLLDPMWGEFSSAYGLRGTKAPRVIHYASSAPWKHRPTAAGMLWWDWLADRVGFEALGQEGERFRRLCANVRDAFRKESGTGFLTRAFRSHMWWKRLSERDPNVRATGDYAFPRRLRKALGRAWGLALPEALLRPFGKGITLEPECDLAHAGTCVAPLDVGWGSVSDSPLRQVRMGRWARVGKAVAFIGPESNGVVRIGHGADVGDGARLTYGVTLGEGAHVAPGATVTEDVPPYAVVSGSPARVTGTRAEPEVWHALSALRWWDYDLSPLGGRALLASPAAALKTLRVAIREGHPRRLVPEVVSEDLLVPYRRGRRHWLSLRRKGSVICLLGQWLMAMPPPRRRWGKAVAQPPASPPEIASEPTSAPSPTPRISVSFCISDNFAQHLAVLATSLLERTPGRPFVFHVLAKALSDETRRRLLRMEADWDGRCRFVLHAVDRSRFDAFPLPLEHITQEMYYRYLLPEMLPEERRTLYLDVDVLALGDLSPLWDLDLGDCLLAGVPDGKKDTPEWREYKRRLGLGDHAIYVNSGVLLMDLEGLRRFGFGAKCMEATGRLHDRIAWPDQDVINLTAKGRILPLPRRWNCMDPRTLPRGERPILRHFASFSSKPWCCLWKNHTWPSYLRFLLRTPYRDHAPAFVLAHLKGFFWFRYVKKGVERTLVCGILVRKRRISATGKGGRP